MLEKYAIYVIVLGVLITVVGFIWLVVRAFKYRPLWGWAVLLCPPTGAIFIWRHFSLVRGPLRVLVLACLIAASPFALNYYERHFIPLKPYEQVLNGELRITLTGLKDFDYATLREKPLVVVLQMANPDVDDRTLENLKGMDRLAVLDLNGTHISDEGLAVIAVLPQLNTLRIARTKITDEGFRANLISKNSLLYLDLTGTEIKGKTKREWKAQRPDDREYVD
jgi:Leucine Rich repeat